MSVGEYIFSPSLSLSLSLSFFLSACAHNCNLHMPTCACLPMSSCALPYLYGEQFLFISASAHAHHACLHCPTAIQLVAYVPMEGILLIHMAMCVTFVG